MRTVALPRFSAVLLVASCSLFTLPPATTSALPPQTTPNAPPPTAKSERPPAGHPQENGPGPQTKGAPKVAPKTPKQEAWQMLTTACTGDQANARATAVRVLGLLTKDVKALSLAEKALDDGKPDVRAAAAAALGDMKARTSIPKLRVALDDSDPSVALAAAHSLELMRDSAAYAVYYEVLTGQRKVGRGLIASQTSVLKDPKRMAQLGFEEGIGFIPFAGIGWDAIKVMTKDDSSPVRAAAAKVLAKDPDPAATTALTDAVGDKSWLVRAAALEALAKRGDSSALDAIRVCMSDEKDAVKYTAAAAVLRLTAIRESGLAVSQRGKKNPLPYHP